MVEGFDVLPPWPEPPKSIGKIEKIPHREKTKRESTPQQPQSGAERRLARLAKSGEFPFGLALNILGRWLYFVTLLDPEYTRSGDTQAVWAAW